MEVLNREADIVVPYGSTVHGEEEIAAVVAVLKSSTQMGKRVQEMEQRVSVLFAKKHGVMVNSGSSANHLALEILKLPPGSEVITPVLTFATTAAPIIKNQLVPAFVDVEENTFNIDPACIDVMINSNTRAMMIPNLLGNLPDWKFIRDLANQYNLVVIEDSADTVGAAINNLPTGYYSDITTTSFYGSHVINCAGNGGMLCVNDPALADRAKLLRSWGRSSSLFADSGAIENRFNVEVGDIPYDAKFILEEIGYNFEPSEMGAAFGLVQLARLEHHINLRQRHFKRHLEFFSHYHEWLILPQQFLNSSTSWLAFPLIVRDSAPFTRTQLQIFFEKHQIHTRTVFSGNILRQPGFANTRRNESARGYPHADQVMRGGILLACHQGLTDDMINHMHQIFELFVSHY